MWTTRNTRNEITKISSSASTDAGRQKQKKISWDQKPEFNLKNSWNIAKRKIRWIREEEDQQIHDLFS